MNNVDIGEIKKFDGVADIWWDVNGEMGTLHVINPLRLQFITERLTSPAPKMLDVGCGGGILSEALAKFGAQVTGIDLSQASLNSAAAHAQAGGLNIEYQNIRAEDLARERPAAFDAVTCMEMLEHVPQPQAVIASCAQALKPGGHAFFPALTARPKRFCLPLWAANIFCACCRAARIPITNSFARPR